MSVRTPEVHLAELQDLLHKSKPGLSSATESLAISEALGRVVATDIRATIDSPAFDNSQMDGYALNTSQLKGGKFRLGATIPAGTDPKLSCPEGPHDDTVVAIMTGAAIPTNCAAIIPVEAGTPDTFAAVESNPDRTVTLPPVAAGSFIRRQGVDISAGSLIIPAGTVIDAIAIAAMIGQGLKQVEVYRRPRVLICTGGAEISDTPSAVTIPDSNAPMLEALCQQWGLNPIARLHTNDDPEILATELSAAIAKYRPDAVLTSGGISHGRYEVVRQVLEKAPSWFGHVAQQPGGPQGWGIFDETPIICLPGNPVSTLVSFRTFVVPLLSPYLSSKKLSSKKPNMGGYQAQLQQAVSGLKGGKDQFRRAKVIIASTGQAEVTMVGEAGSHFLAQAIGANCLARIPAGADLPIGATVTIYPLTPESLI
ncbi:molybdopterin molybdotransferase MoeA [Corynebacterium caspium]|uniref:molybdopterin molybdotransferase MoeA n=1 Tax=Corynebacterium caspium TaxID=234828 RepID=UPI0003738FDE|nr:molybdopterin molybdotransferase MoeA [Corynebacterium caspium]WKD59473.1 Molybdopterin molybdenumtransferase [Corynebacterium caspium DSM 44850]